MRDIWPGDCQVNETANQFSIDSWFYKKGVVNLDLRSRVLFKNVKEVREERKWKNRRKEKEMEREQNSRITYWVRRPML